MIDDYVSVSQAAKELGLSITQVRNLCVSGKLKAIPPADWRIEIESVESYKKSARKTGRPRKGTNKMSLLQIIDGLAYNYDDLVIEQTSDGETGNLNYMWQFMQDKSEKQATFSGAFNEDGDGQILIFLSNVNEPDYIVTKGS